MARILILRERGAAARTARLVHAMGDEPLVVPTEQIEQIAADLPPGPFGGLIVTSANAVPFLANRVASELPPVLAVGRATADALAAIGMRPSFVGVGLGAGLAEPAAALHATSRLPLVYLAGHVRAGELERALATKEVPFEIVAVYETLRLDPEPAAVARLLTGGPPDAVLLLSVAQAYAFERLLQSYPRYLDPPPVPLCLSPRICAALPPPLRQAALVAPRPELSALLNHYRHSLDG